MNSVDKKNYSEAIKNYVIAIGVIVGGLWAAYVFDAKLEVKNARARLEKINLELTQRPVIVPNIEVFIGQTESYKNWFLKIIISIENNGNSDTQLMLDDHSVRVAIVNLTNGKITSYSDIIYTRCIHIPKDETELPYVNINSVTLLAGQKKNIIALVEVSEKGLYEVNFIARPGKGILDVREKVKETQANPVIGTGEFIMVGVGPNNGFS